MSIISVKKTEIVYKNCVESVKSRRPLIYNQLSRTDRLSRVSAVRGAADSGSVQSEGLLIRVSSVRGTADSGSAESEGLLIQGQCSQRDH